jgi:hypothetical protein
MPHSESCHLRRGEAVDALVLARRPVAAFDSKQKLTEEGSLFA